MIQKTNIDCEYYQDLMIDLIHQQVNEEERTKIEQHIAQCPDCQKVWAENQALLQQMATVQSPSPNPEMRTRFYAMLGTYKNEVEAKKENSLGAFWQKIKAAFTYQPSYNWAYSLVLLFSGLLMGYWLGKPDNQDVAYQKQVETLSSQMQEMRQMMMLSMLENPTATERMKAVSYTEQLQQVDDKVIDALLTTLNYDENVNVRIVTLEALMPLANHPKVREGLIQSLVLQESPLVQVALADAMVRLQEKKSVKEFRRILRKNNLNIMVKDKIEKSILKLS
jgi:Zn-finger nucleic acid-binding protein